MPRLFHRSVSVLRAIERARGQPAAVCFAVRDDEKPSSGGMTVRKANLPAEVRKPDNRPVQTADQVIAEIAAKIAPYKPKPEWEGMSPEEMFERAWEHSRKKEYEEATKWCRRAAEQGHAEAQTNLGGAYRKGLGGVPLDMVEAVKWYRRAAEQGNAVAQANLGMAYEMDDGVPLDMVEAEKWYRRAAEQGYAGGQFLLGLLYDNGLSKNRTEAEKWYRRAAEQGCAKAQKKLAQILRREE